MGDCHCPKIPTKATLKKYGLTAQEYFALARNGCHVCGRPGATRPLAVDHHHVKGWKQMPPAERRKYVRGVLCYLDNRFLGVRGVSTERLRRMADYIENDGRAAQEVLRNE